MSKTPSTNLPEHVRSNRDHWDSVADQWVAPGERSWNSGEPYWGVWSLPESELHLLPEDMTGLSTIELGCGTGYVSGWMVRRGAIATGIDSSERQLETARRLAAEHGLAIDLIHGNAESVDRPDGSFDFAVSEYGAAIWCDPQAWIPEAHRLLRAGGQLVFLGTTPLAIMTTPSDGAMSEPILHRDYFKLYRVDWREVEIDPGGIEFNLPVSDWLRLFRTTGFDLEDYLELQAPADLEGNPFHSPVAWGKRWPYEHVFKLRKRVSL